MDGYDSYAWNQGYYQDSMVYPPHYEGFGYINGRNFEDNYPMPQVFSHYQEWGIHDVRATLKEMLGMLLKRFEENDSRCEEMFPLYENIYETKAMVDAMIDGNMEITKAQFNDLISQLKAFLFQVENITIMENHQEVGEEENENEEEEKWKENEEGPSKKDRIDNFLVESDEEECPLMDMSNNEQENLEALKNEMSISKPSNSSICILIEVDASIDFILPLVNFDYRKEVMKCLGILGKKEERRKMRVREQEEIPSRTMCKIYMGDWSTNDENLHDFEAQRMRYNGKEDRYPWPFR